jgi:hypothetical protein
MLARIAHTRYDAIALEPRTRRYIYQTHMLDAALLARGSGQLCFDHRARNGSFAAGARRLESRPDSEQCACGHRTRGRARQEGAITKQVAQAHVQWHC